MVSTDPLSRYDAFFLDIDGVLVRESSPIDGAADALRALQQRGKTLFLTNNSTRSRIELADRLTGLGFAAAPEDVVPSSYVAARYLAEQAGPTPYWIVGEPGLDAELRLAGHRPSRRPEEAEWVVAGIDWTIDYAKLADALRALRSGARLIATNRDPTFPGRTEHLPGAGAILGALEGMGYSPEVTVGKPSPIAFRYALERLGDAAPSVLMIGDRLETDIAGANAAGLESALVLTGVAARAEATTAGIQFTWIADSLAAVAAGRLEPGPAPADERSSSTMLRSKR